MSIIELIEAGNLSARLAALFWIGVERGASIIVAADPPSSGKTTTLSALLSFTPPETAVYFTRGYGEPFALPPLSESYATYILINELSDHIPVYTWDDNARRAFELVSQGYRLASTMHADTVDGVLAQLRGDLHIPAKHIAALTFIVPLHIGRAGRLIRRVAEVVLVGDSGDDVTTGQLARWQESTDTFEILGERLPAEALAEWAGLSPAQLEKETDSREAFLNSLQEKGASSIPEVNSAIEQYYERLAPGSQASSAGT